MPGFDPEATLPPRRPAAPPSPLGPTQAGAAAPAPEEQARPGDPATRPEDRRSPARPDRPVLPDITSDERDIGWGDLPEPGDDDRYLREIPPHHGG